MDKTKNSGDAEPVDNKKSVQAEKTSYTTEEMVQKIIERRQKRTDSADKKTKDESNMSKPVEEVADSDKEDDVNGQHIDVEDEVSGKVEENSGEEGTKSPDTKDEASMEDVEDGEDDNENTKELLKRYLSDKDEEGKSEDEIDEASLKDEEKSSPSIKKLLKKLRKTVAEREAFREKYEESRTNSAVDTKYDDEMNLEKVRQEQISADNTIDFINDVLDGKPELDDDGNELPYKFNLGGKEFQMTRQQLIAKRSEVKKTLRFDIPQRIQELESYYANKKESDQVVNKFFNWVNEKEGSKYNIYKEWSANPYIKKIMNKLPDSQVILAAAIEKLSEIGSAAKNTNTTSNIKKPATNPIKATNAPRPAVSTTGDATLQKQIDAAYNQYKSSGDIDDYNKYRTLKRKLKE